MITTTRAGSGRSGIAAVGWALALALGLECRGATYQPPVFADANRAERVRALAGEIDQLYHDHAVAGHYPGLAYGIVVDDALVVSGGYGFANREREIRAGPKSVFRIASMTKSFTAMAVMRLRDAGKLDLDQPVARFLPEVRRLKLLTRDSPSITPRHLLTHGAGFPEDNPWGDRQLADTEEELVSLVREPAQFANAPGVAYQYSNLGFALLGRVVHRVSGRSCQGYITSHILEPLQMRSTYWDYHRVPPDALAHGYRWRDDHWDEEAMLGDGSYGPMGGLLSTIEDFARYVSFHLAAWPPRDDPETGPVRRASVREMQHPWRIRSHNLGALAADGTSCPTVGAYGYGLGWTEDCQKRVTIAHTGGLPGFGSQWRILPDYGVGIIAFGNVTYADFGVVHVKVQELLLRKAGLLPRALPASAILEKRGARLVELLPDWEGAERSGIFAENFFADDALESLRAKCRELFERVGPIEAVERIQPTDQLRGNLRLRGRHGELTVFLTLTPENPPLIQEFGIRDSAAPE